MRSLLILPALALMAPAQTPRPVAKPVSELLPSQATPEGAYAAIAQAYAKGAESLAPLFPARVANRLPKGAVKPQPEPTRSHYATAKVEEVLEQEGAAAVLATLGDGKVDLWFLQMEEGRWVLLGNDQPRNLAKARQQALAQLPALAARAPEPAPAIADPKAHLAVFMKHLQARAQDPKAFLLDAMKRHDVVGFGEIHNRVASWDLLKALVQDPAFPDLCGTIYLELPRHGQPLMDRFLASGTLDLEPVREILRSLFHGGWPCADEVEFLAALWTVNHSLEPARRLRVVLVDQAWDWAKVKVKTDLATLETDRDALMAERILADLKARPDRRSTLFQVGYLHLPTGRKRGGKAYRCAGQRLRTVLGERLFTVVQHGPVLGNRGGQVEGRVRKGLFDEAFATHGNRPAAFALKDSPFGREPFDMALDLRGMEATFGGAFDGYLFLGPLEQDRHSAVAKGFYTEAFATEVDRRCRLMFGAGVQEVEGLDGGDAAALEAGQARWMGHEAYWVKQLGPVDAWR